MYPLKNLPDNSGKAEVLEMIQRRQQCLMPFVLQFSQTVEVLLKSQ